MTIIMVNFENVLYESTWKLINFSKKCRRAFDLKISKWDKKKFSLIVDSMRLRQNRVEYKTMKIYKEFVNSTEP